MGTKYTVKQDLLDKVISLIFSNSTFETSSQDIQDAFCDAIESLWDRGDISLVDTDYTTLLSDLNSSSLSVGALYRFSYQTKYVVDYVAVDGSGASGERYNTDITTIQEVDENYTVTASAYTVPTETFVAVAIASNKLHPIVVSEENPDDIIIYDILDNTTEETGATPGNRNGFVQSREYPKDRIKTSFDFRAALTKLNKINENIVVKQTADNPVLNDFGTPVDNRTMRFGMDSTGALGTLSGVVYADEYYFRMLGPYLNPSLPSPSAVYYSDITIGAKTSSLSQYGGEETAGRIPNIGIIATSALDVTIGSDGVNILLGTRLVENVKIGNKNSNIIFNGTSQLFSDPIEGQVFTQNTITKNIEFGNRVANTAIIDADTFSLGSDSDFMLVTGTIFKSTIKESLNTLDIVDGVNEANIGRGCANILSWGGAYTLGEDNGNLTLIFSGTVDAPITIGSGNDGISFVNSYGVKMGDTNSNSFYLGTESFIVGQENANITIQGLKGGSLGSFNDTIETVASGTDVLTVGDGNINCRLELTKGTIGNNNENLYVLDPISTCTIGDNCSDIIAYASPGLLLGNLVRSSIITFSTDVQIESGANMVTISAGSDTIVGKNADQIVSAQHALTIVPDFIFPSTYLGLVYPTNYPTLMSQTFVDLRKLLPVDCISILGPGSAGATALGNTIKNNTSAVFIAGISSSVVEDNAEDIQIGQEVALDSDVIVYLRASEPNTEYRLDYVPNKGGAPTVGGREVTKDVAGVEAVNTVLGGIADLGITGQGTGARNTVKTNKTNVKILGTCTDITVDAEDVSISGQSNITAKVPCTISSLATGDVGAVIEAVSPDNSPWYKTIDNAGVVTWNSYV